MIVLRWYSARPSASRTGSSNIHSGCQRDPYISEVCAFDECIYNPHIHFTSRIRILTSLPKALTQNLVASGGSCQSTQFTLQPTHSCSATETASHSFSHARNFRLLSPSSRRSGASRSPRCDSVWGLGSWSTLCEHCAMIGFIWRWG